MKKKIIALCLALCMALSLAACGGSSSSDTTTDASTVIEDESTAAEEPEETAEEEPLDLTGTWFCDDADDEISFEAVIEGETITVTMDTLGTAWTYWAGSYVAPANAEDDYSWTSEKDSSLIDDDTLTAPADTLDFSYSGGILACLFDLGTGDEAVELAFVREDGETDAATTSADTGTKENPADPTEATTVDTGWAEFTVQLTGAYTSQDAIDLLADIGEDTADFEEPLEAGYRLVVLEYAVEATSGFEDDSFILGDYLGWDFWSTDFNSRYDYYCLELMANSSSDFCYMDYHNGDSGTVYAVYNLPEAVDEFMLEIEGNWFHYFLA